MTGVGDASRNFYIANVKEYFLFFGKVVLNTAYFKKSLELRINLYNTLNAVRRHASDACSTLFSHFWKFILKNITNNDRAQLTIWQNGQTPQRPRPQKHL